MFAIKLGASYISRVQFQVPNIFLLVQKLRLVLFLAMRQVFKQRIATNDYYTNRCVLRRWNYKFVIMSSHLDKDRLPRCLPTVAATFSVISDHD